MIKLIKKVLFKSISILNKLEKIGARTNADIQAARAKKWFEDKGDETHRLNYPLNENSIVFDIGGYKGEFAMEVYCRYNCTTFIFEPIPEFYERIVHRFFNTNKIKAFNFGLGNNDCKLQISLEDNSSSLYKKGINSLQVQIRSFNDFLEENHISTIDLLKINIEGSEYDLLESIIEAGNITKIHNIQVQFHDFVPNALERMNLIQNKLSQTHQLTYQYTFVWENWKLIQ